MNLFVIGNGFDRAHGLNTLYTDFRDYLDSVDWGVLASLESMYGICTESSIQVAENYLWRDFETNLSHIDEAEIIDTSMNCYL